MLVGVSIFAVVGASADSAGRRSARATLPGKVSISVPAGWHVLHGWLSDVIDPAPRLAVGSFRVRLSRHTCECGMPNVRDFPRNGGFLFMWEYLRYPRRDLRRVPRRPAHFRIETSQ